MRGLYQRKGVLKIQRNSSYRVTHQTEEYICDYLVFKLPSIKEFRKKWLNLKIMWLSSLRLTYCLKFTIDYIGHLEKGQNRDHAETYNHRANRNYHESRMLRCTSHILNSY